MSGILTPISGKYSLARFQVVSIQGKRETMRAKLDVWQFLWSTSETSMESDTNTT